MQVNEKTLTKQEILDIATSNVTKQRLIGLVGPAQAGKDTACNACAYYRIAFADELKLEATYALRSIGIDLDFIHDDEAKKEWRGLLVDLGEWRRKHIAADYWLKKVESKIILSRQEHDHICITDCRYLNECEMIKRLGGMIVYISRPGIKPANPVERASINQILYSGIIDYYIENNGSIVDLKNRLEAIA